MEGLLGRAAATEAVAVFSLVAVLGGEGPIPFGPTLDHPHWRREDCSNSEECVKESRSLEKH